MTKTKSNMDLSELLANHDQLNTDAAVPQEGPQHKPPKVISETNPQAAWSIKDGPGRFS